MSVVTEPQEPVPVANGVNGAGLGLEQIKPRFLETQLAESLRYVPAWEASTKDTVRRRPRQNLGILDHARDALLSAMEGLTAVERSNGFDAWRRLINQAAGEVETTTASGAVIGALLASVGRDDVVDFTPEDLGIFFDITNLLRMPRLSEPDMTRAITGLCSTGHLRLLPSVPDDDDVASLDAEIERALTKHA